MIPEADAKARRARGRTGRCHDPAGRRVRRSQTAEETDCEDSPACVGPALSSPAVDVAGSMRGLRNINVRSCAKPPSVLVGGRRAFGGRTGLKSSPR
ncbi:hypothetical protein QFZ56_007495 [Streptomyces achromogenes]|uniref:Uncharacterized protein n=1 Tax=Streptomyces achromogenes TaxID=67255 RepID=A0ABU0QCZ3_STRAH|nr:hypothetical protein [Streptomyces achromogenes]